MLLLIIMVKRVMVTRVKKKKLWASKRLKTEMEFMA